MEQRESFIFYRSFYEAIRELPRDIQGEIYTAIMEYGLYCKETEDLKPIARAMFMLIKPQLDVNFTRFENAKLGGAPKGSHNNPYGRRGKPNNEEEQTENKPRTNQELTKNLPNLNLNLNLNLNHNLSLSLEGTERETFLNFLLFSKGLIHPLDELERFLAHYDKTDWITSTGTKITNKLSALKSWKCEGSVFAEATLARLHIWQKIVALFTDVDKTLLLSDFRGFNLEDNKLIIYVSESLHKAIKLVITDEIRDNLVKIVGVKPNWRIAK